jgi:hypothetical protein
LLPQVCQSLLLTLRPSLLLLLLLRQRRQLLRCQVQPLLLTKLWLRWSQLCCCSTLPLCCCVPVALPCTTLQLPHPRLPLPLRLGPLLHVWQASTARC